MINAIIIVTLCGIFAFTLAFVEGANGVANSMGTVYGARVLGIGKRGMRNTLLLGVVCEVAGCLILGS